MATQEELDALVVDLKGSLDTVGVGVSSLRDKLSSVSAQVADLQAQLAAADSDINVDGLKAAVDEAKSEADSLADVVPAPSVPVEETPVEQPPVEDVPSVVDTPVEEPAVEAPADAPLETGE